jgi:endonuclease YncB( thermonuclease family)
MFQYAAEVLRIIDGDTLWLNLDLGFRTHLEVDVRLADINAPEVVNFRVSGLQDRAVIYIRECVPPGATCVVDITRPDKYGRWLGTIRYLKGSVDRDEILQKGTVLNDELLARGFVKPYKK